MKNKWIKLILLIMIVSLVSSFAIGATNDTPQNLEVVESGSNGNGEYIKYSDGTMVCTIDKDLGKLTMRQMQTNKMWRSFTPNVYFAETFIDEPSITVNTSAGEITGIANRRTENSYANFTLMSVQNISHIDVSIKVRAEGRWKP